MPSALGVTLDLVVLVPLLGYLILVRRGRMPAVGLIPLAFVGLLVATAIVPAEHQGTLRVLEAVVLPLEIGLLGWIAHRATRRARTVARDAVTDPVETFRNAPRNLVSSDRVALTDIGTPVGPRRAHERVPSPDHAAVSKPC